jgi:hypothetical protein
MLTLAHLLTPFGFDASRPTKLVRHTDPRRNLRALYRAGQFDIYQSIQSTPVFADCELLVSFLGEPGNHAVFVGAYKVIGGSGPKTIKLPADFLEPEMDTSNHYEYVLERDTRFDEFKDRLVIDWGKGARSWVQKFKAPSKSVVEVLPKGYVREFPGFLDFTLSLDELRAIVDHPLANREWHRMLGSVAGVYLILDTETGKQYVGSAYGKRGILGRWRDYSNTGHGNNQQLRALVNARPNAATKFQFCVLQTLPTTLTPQEVIAHEVMHKRKLGSRAHGLNSN